MPPKKARESIASNGGDEGAETIPAKQSKDGMSVEDLSLPKSMIGRLAKGVLPANTQIQRDALLALHKSATVFVSYIASNSNEIAQAAGKKTILPQDVIAALKDCELEGFIPRLESELKKYNETQCDKRNTYRRKVKEEKAAAAGGKEGDTSMNGDATEGANGAQSNGHPDEDDADRPTKKLKGVDGIAVSPDADDDDDDADPDADEDVMEEVSEGGEDDTFEDAEEMQIDEDQGLRDPYAAEREAEERAESLEDRIEDGQSDDDGSESD